MLRSSLLCTFKLSAFYGTLLALTIAVPAVGALLGKAKWLHFLLAGIGAGLTSERITKAEGLISIAQFSFLLACGWAVFSAIGKGLDSERTLISRKCAHKRRGSSHWNGTSATARSARCGFRI